jgi:hypothetical protein
MLDERFGAEHVLGGCPIVHLLVVPALLHPGGGGLRREGPI